jgi:hypothetical protein
MYLEVLLEHIHAVKAGQTPLVNVPMLYPTFEEMKENQ